MKKSIILFNTNSEAGEFYFNSCVNMVIRDGALPVHPTIWDHYRKIDFAEVITQMVPVIDCFYLFIDHGVSFLMVNIVEQFYRCGLFSKEIRVEFINDSTDTLRSILSEVAEKTEISVDRIKSRSRKREVVAARQYYCVLSRKRTKRSLQSIGSEVNRGHATVLHALKTVGNVKELREEFINLFEPHRQNISHIEKAILIGRSPVKSEPIKQESRYSHVLPANSRAFSGYRQHSL